ncbi:DEAD/DEAH box helicase [Pseudooceanicola sp. C21-150M6]|uniref:DEAD/DEAH box helicase n=1 Tax=Pseudooceanicola sp. C21-150M6 TaxID=3434355 RepID=UPI003D7F2422
MIQTLSDALAERGYDTLTPVQEAVTNPELQHVDLLVSAQTGSGKTVGFGLAIAETLLEGAEIFGPAAAPLALIVAPTRELAFQVMRELQWLYSKAGARVSSCVGGMDMRDERRALERGAHIVVGTPGRLTDHIRRGSLDLTAIRAVVLDEADEMLDLGFREDLEFMLGEAPEDRRTLLFSATVPPMIVTLAQQYQRDAVRVTTISDKGQHADISYQALRVAQQDAENAIINVLRYHEAQNAIVFANTRATVNRLTARFSNRGFSVVCLSGELSQTERSHALQAMRDGRARVCVATDVAARGIDLPNLELVIHAELPTNSETLLHRSGRTGRAGRKGVSALIVPPKSVKKAERLLKFAKVAAEWTTAPEAEEILARDEERLLGDPSWQEPLSEAETEFAARLLAEQSPEAVAAAFLRLFRAGHSAPEDLSDPDTRPERAERKERAPFGPSRWFSLSVGRNDRAEARWLLPLLLRHGNMEKAAIGAIRVRDDETFVEIAEPAVESFVASLGDGGVIEDGVAAKLLDGEPDLGRPSGPPRDRGERRGPPADRGPGRERGPKREPRPAPAPRAPREEPSAMADRDSSPAPAAAARPPHEERSERRVWSDPKPKREDRPEGDRGPRKPAGERNKPAWKGDRKEDGPRGRGPAGKPGGKPGGKPWKSSGEGAGGDRPARDGGKPYKGGKGPGKPGGGKPEGFKGKSEGFRGKPDGFKGKGKPGGSAGGPKKAGGPARAAATDTSKRFTPPGKPVKAGPGGKKAGGMQPPKRRKP